MGDSHGGLWPPADQNNSRNEANGAGGGGTTVPGIRSAHLWGDILHDLNNVLVSILLNAQVIEWKLPSYSRIRRNVHEVERSAQRGAVLVSRMKQWAGGGEARVHGGVAAVEDSTGEQRRTGECSGDGIVADGHARGGRGLKGTSSRKKVPHTMV
jgi:hypothetical protein